MVGVVRVYVGGCPVFAVCVVKCGVFVHIITTTANSTLCCCVIMLLLACSLFLFVSHFFHMI